jgi:hypothetical protein
MGGILDLEDTNSLEPGAYQNWQARPASPAIYKVLSIKPLILTSIPVSYSE